MSKAFQVFMGYDPRQPVAFHVAAHSLISRASKPVALTRLQLNQLPITRRGLTEFTYSRFIVPYLSDFDGYSLFIDSDMLVLDDILKVFDTIDPSAWVSVVQSFDAQRMFERPSFMLYNNKRCRILTPEYVDDPKHPLFDLAWAGRIGALPKEWNHLVGYSLPNPAAKVIHYTKGVPCWPETGDCEWSAEWHHELKTLCATVSFQELMGSSVHVKAG